MNLILVKQEFYDGMVILTFRDENGDTFLETLSVHKWDAINEALYEQKKEENRVYMRDYRMYRQERLLEYIEGLSESALRNPVPDPVGDRIERHMEFHLMREAMKTLTPTQKRRLYAYCVEGLTYQQIADREGTAYFAVYESIKGAVKKVAKFL